MTKILLAALLVLPAPALAQGLLDQQLGPASATPPTPAAPEKTNPAAKPPAANTPATTPPAPTAIPTTPPPGGSDIISPDAVKRVDDADLINKLTKTDDATKQQNDAAEQMKNMIERMGQSQTRLSQVDPGDVTQETQRRIITDLDYFIELARKQQQQSQSQSQQQQQQQQDRQYSSGNQQGNNQGGSTAARQSFLPQGGQATPATGEDIRAHAPDEWGKLRPRERDLISHGANEEYLAPYREMIERYYQALAELGKTRNR